jgi:hypothetical protein
VEGDGLKVKPAVKVHGDDDVLESRTDTLNSSDVLLFKSKRNRRRWNLGRGGRGRTSGRVWGDGDRGCRG